MSDRIKNLDLFDANCMLGRIFAPKPGFPLSVEELLAVMDDFQIAEALVYHALSKEHHPAVGNRLLMDQIASCDRLHAIWVIMPSHTGEFPPEEQLVEQMLAQDVRAVRVFPHPDRHNFLLTRWAAGRLLESLQRRRVPLFIDEEEIDFHAVHELCGGYPELPLVLTNVGYRSDRFLYPLWEEFPNLHIELSSYCGHGGIEALTERFGAEKLLFGTRLPYFTPGSAIGMLSYANISQADRRLIAGDNLRNLLKRAGEK
jgi:amidohydrolase family protein